MQRRRVIQALAAAGAMGGSPAGLWALAPNATLAAPAVDTLPPLEGKLTLYLGHGEGGLDRPLAPFRSGGVTDAVTGLKFRRRHRGAIRFRLVSGGVTPEATFGRRAWPVSVSFIRPRREGA